MGSTKAPKKFFSDWTREERLAFSACMWAEVTYLGVRDGRCHFEVYYLAGTEIDYDYDGEDDAGPHATASVSVEGLPVEDEPAEERIIGLISDERERLQKEYLAGHK